MNLRNELYEIIEKKTSEGYLIRMNRNSMIYRVHFPGQPVTPGVCIIQIVTELLQDFLGCNLRLQEVVNAKFLAVIDPDSVRVLKVSFAKIIESPSSYKVTATVSDENEIFTKLSLVYIKE